MRNSFTSLKIDFKLIVLLITLLLIIIAYLFLPKIITTSFQYDSDWHWCDESITFFIMKNKRFPSDWNEILKFSSNEGYSPIFGIEKRAELNFDLFNRINNNNGRVNSDYWCYRVSGHDQKIQKYIKIRDSVCDYYSCSGDVLRQDKPVGEEEECVCPDGVLPSKNEASNDQTDEN